MLNNDSFYEKQRKEAKSQFNDQASTTIPEPVNYVQRPTVGGQANTSSYSNGYQQQHQAFHGPQGKQGTLNMYNSGPGMNSTTSFSKFGSGTYGSAGPNYQQQQQPVSSQYQYSSSMPPQQPPMASSISASFSAHAYPTTNPLMYRFDRSPQFVLNNLQNLVVNNNLQMNANSQNSNQQHQQSGQYSQMVVSGCQTNSADSNQFLNMINNSSLDGFESLDPVGPIYQQVETNKIFMPVHSRNTDAGASMDLESLAKIKLEDIDEEFKAYQQPTANSANTQQGAFLVSHDQNYYRPSKEPVDLNNNNQVVRKSAEENSGRNKGSSSIMSALKNIFSSKQQAKETNPNNSITNWS